MRMTMLQYAIMAAVAGMPALAPVVGSLDQIQAGARAANQVSQYCAPPQENTEAPKFYCRQPMPTAIEADRLFVDSTSLAKHSDGACVMALSLGRVASPPVSSSWVKR
jgi:hypothetical protein